MLDRELVFITGLHRSGTSPLHRCLREHPQVSGFRYTGVPEDEGQHLQTVLPRGGYYGGPGRFGRHSEAHMTETHPLANPDTAEALWAQWSPHWDTSKPFLVEKTPISLLRTRFLQALFPNSYFVVILRHPAPVALATLNALASFGAVGDLTVADQIEHWLLCHGVFLADASYLRRHIIVRYEQFVAKPQVTVDAICSFVGLPPHPLTERIEMGANSRYLAQWRAMGEDSMSRSQVEDAMRLEDRAAKFGYSLADWGICAPIEA